MSAEHVFTNLRVTHDQVARVRVVPGYGGERLVALELKGGDLLRIDGATAQFVLEALANERPLRAAGGGR